VRPPSVGYPLYLFSLSFLASNAFQNVPDSYFIVFVYLKILVAQAFAVGGPGDPDGLITG
jgi:hypothetical protein